MGGKVETMHTRYRDDATKKFQAHDGEAWKSLKTDFDVVSCGLMEFSGASFQVVTREKKMIMQLKMERNSLETACIFQKQ